MKRLLTLTVEACVEGRSIFACAACAGVPSPEIRAAREPVEGLLLWRVAGGAEEVHRSSRVGPGGPVDGVQGGPEDLAAVLRRHPDVAKQSDKFEYAAKLVVLCRAF